MMHSNAWQASRHSRFFKLVRLSFVKPCLFYSSIPINDSLKLGFCRTEQPMEIYQTLFSTVYPPQGSGILYRPDIPDTIYPLWVQNSVT